MPVISRGRFYEDGPYTCCDSADVHPQPCLCAARDRMRIRESLDRMAEAGQVEGIYDATEGGWGNRGDG